MKNTGIILILMFLTVTVFQSCQDDITKYDDPRDPIVKLWRVTDDTPVGATGYDVTIAKDGDEIIYITLDNFHGVDILVKANLSSSSTSNIITLRDNAATQEIVSGNTTYTVSKFEGVVSINLESIDFEYTIDDGDGPINVIANFGKVVTAKKKAVASLQITKILSL